MKSTQLLLFLALGICTANAVGAESAVPPDASIAPQTPPALAANAAEPVTLAESESETTDQHCAKAAKKARRKSLWAAFLLSMVSGAGNTLSATQKADITMTDQDGRKTRGTITYVDPVKRSYLNARDSEFNANAAMEVYSNNMRKAGCL